MLGCSGRKLLNLEEDYKMTSEEVLNQLMEVLKSDNGGAFYLSPENKERAIPAIDGLLILGFFKDDPNDLGHSFWIAAAGEETQMHEYFKSGGDNWAKLNNVLNDIFEASFPEEITS